MSDLATLAWTLAQEADAELYIDRVPTDDPSRGRPNDLPDNLRTTSSVAILAQALKVRGLFSVFFTLPSCSLVATVVDEATIVQAIMHGLASGEGQHDRKLLLLQAQSCEPIAATNVVTVSICQCKRSSKRWFKISAGTRVASRR